MPDHWFARHSLLGPLLLLAGAVGCRAAAREFHLSPPPETRPTAEGATTTPAETPAQTPAQTRPAEETAADLARAADADARFGPPPPMDQEWDYFTTARTFAPLLADPRWPGFATTLRFQSGGRHLNTYEAINLGDSFALARGPARWFGRTFESEIGVAGGTFSVFDPGHQQDLFSIDYIGSAYYAVRRGRFSALGRYWHLSAHVGDEFLLSDNYGGRGREDLLLENLQALVSYDLDAGVRVYGGGTYRLDVAPDEYGSFQLQYGVEWQSEYRYGDARPILAVDGQSLSGFDFDPSVSVRGGLSFDQGRPRHLPAFRVTAEFFTGRDPNGQFFDDHVLYTGLGFTFNF